MVGAIADWNGERAAAGETPVLIGIGVHFGPVVGGDTGDEHRLECAVIGDTTKDTIPGNKQTKAARLVDLVRHTRGGKIMNGYDPQLDPYNNPPPPIIDGLRHGIVPVGMRKNKF